jgi:hypothetical protein
MAAEAAPDSAKPAFEAVDFGGVSRTHLTWGMVLVISKV